MFRSLFTRKKAPLTGAPAAKRLKNYSARTGYVYQYFYAGHREYRSRDDHGVEFVFRASHDRKQWRDIPVMVSSPALEAWQTAHGRELSSAERYAIAKIALFQAFDERGPAQVHGELRVRGADVEGIIEALDL